MATMGVAGEIAEAKRLKNKTGNASFRTDLIDAVFNMTAGQLQEAIHYEVYKK
jgi:hydroxyethylthiazole kinase